MEAKEGWTAGIAAMIAGALFIESAITKVCPLNALLGINIQQNKSFLSQLKYNLQQAVFSSHRKNLLKRKEMLPWKKSQQNLKASLILAGMFFLGLITFIPQKMK